MKTSGNTVLITGGGSGIGLAFAERFLKAGNQVIVCGRREEKLREAKEKFPSLHTRVCDVGNAEERIALVHWVQSEFPDLNVLVNNAGIQQRVNLLRADKDWGDYQKEMAINLEAPVHLSMLLTPHFCKHSDAAFVNVSSGLAISPATWAPIYSATKAALHSFTVTLRLQLEKTNVTVVEVLPPAVNTDLGGVGLHTFGAPLEDFAEQVFQRIQAGDLEIGYGDSEKRLRASRDEIDAGTRQMWARFLTNNPDF